MAHSFDEEQSACATRRLSVVAALALGIATPCAWSAIVIEGTARPDVIDVSSSAAHDLRGGAVTIGSSARAPPTRSTADTAMTGCKADGADCSSADPATTSSMAVRDDDTRYASPREPCDHWHQRNFRYSADSDGTDTLPASSSWSSRTRPSPTCFHSANRASRHDAASTTCGPECSQRLDATATTVVRRRRHGTAASTCDMRLARFDGDDSFAYTVSDGRGGRRELRPFRRRAQEPHRRGARGKLDQGQRQPLRGGLDAAAAARARQRRAARRSAQDHHGVELDGLGSEPPSPDHLGRRSRQLRRQ